MRKSDFRIRSAGFALGPALFVTILLVPIYDLTLGARIVLGLSLWMGVWWVFETTPIYITALLPLVAFPSSGVLDFVGAAVFYFDKIMFLILGGFFLAAAVERTNLHLRFALNILKSFGTRPRNVIGAFILITGCLSAWMSNTATTLLMLPLATAILAAVASKDRDRFAVYLMLSIAYAAGMGGVATIIGTPPNAIFASLAQSLANTEISFGKWMLIGVPVSAVSLIVLWAYMTRVGRLGAGELFDRKVVTSRLANLGRLSRDEKTVLVVFAVTMAAWLSRGLVWGSYIPAVDDSMISVVAAASLFILPSTKNGRILNFGSARKIPWGVLILIGGGLALAGGFTASGLDMWIASHLGFLASFPYLIVVIVLLFIVVFAEFISNTATTALMIPIAASLSPAIGVSPLMLMVPIAIAASYGFILPSSTPPNAIVLSSGHVTGRKMARTGLPLNIIFIFIISLMTTFLVPLLW